MVLPEFMMRVRLPDSSGYASCPSGDTEFEEAYSKALKDALPVGFEYVKERIGVNWPKDSEGYTYARLRCVDDKCALSECYEVIALLQKKLNRVYDALEIDRRESRRPLEK